MLRRKDKSVADPSSAPPPPPSPSTQPRIVRDPTLGNPRIGPAHAAAGNNDRASLRSAYEQATSWNERAFIIDDLLEMPQLRPMFSQWAADEPTDPLAAVLHGGVLIRAGWDARGRGTSDAVTSDGAADFVRLLNAADEQLDRAVRLDPTSPLPWWNLVTTSRALNISQHELRWRHAEMVSRDPTLHYGHEQMLQGLCAKWGGDDDDMIAFARATATQAGDGSPLYALVVVAHYELSRNFEGGPVAYFAQPDVLTEIRAAADRSVSSAGFVDGSDDITPVLARNWFVLGHGFSNDFDLAAAQLAAIGGRVTRYPWSWWNGEIEDVIADIATGR